MKFYDCAAAPSPRRVRIFLAEKGIDIPMVQVDLRNGEQLGSAFRKINPWGTVPVLVLDDGSAISEAIAVCRYLEAAFPDPSLMGRTPLEQGTIAMWEHRCEHDGMFAAQEAFRNRASGFKDRAVTGLEGYSQIPELAERGQTRVERFFQALDQRLADSEYLAGPCYSVADITAMVAVEFASRIRIELPKECAHVWRWYATVASRPSANA